MVLSDSELERKKQRLHAFRDVLASGAGGSLAAAAAGLGLFPVLGVGIVAAGVIAYLEKDRLEADSETQKF